MADEDDAADAPHEEEVTEQVAREGEPELEPEITPPRPRRPPPHFARYVPDSPVDLTYPVEFEGRTFARIIRRRPSSAVLGAWFERLRNSGPDTPNLSAPLFVDDAGTLIPDEVLGHLDDDDRERVFNDSDPFLPRRLAVALSAWTGNPASPPGDALERTSSGSSAAPAPSSTR